VVGQIAGDGHHHYCVSDTGKKARGGGGGACLVGRIEEMLERIDD